MSKYFLYKKRWIDGGNKTWNDQFYEVRTQEGCRSRGQLKIKWLKPSFTWPWDYMILTALKVPMFKNSETICIPSSNYSVFIIYTRTYFFKFMKQ